MRALFSIKSTASLLALVLGAAVAVAQSPTQNSPYSQVSIASPTAASLGKYADIPVNYHTGIPEVNIPLYTIKEGPLTLPISLSYHGGGVPVMEPASWVGTGWALNAGGVITRTVMGAQDESGGGRVQYGHFSDYGFSSYYTIGGGFLQGPRENGINDDIQGPASYQFLNDIYDGEPDLYTFNFNGYVGKFYFNDDRAPVLVNGEDLKIEYYYPRDGVSTATSISANIQGFVITVPTGDKYYFGITDKSTPIGAPPIEITFPFSQDHEVVTETVFSSYYLTKIIAADGVHTIKLTYEAEKYSYYTISMFPVSPNTPSITVLPQSGPGQGGVSVTNPKEYRLISNNINGVRLAQISFSNGTVSFSPSTSPRTDLGAYINGNGSDEVPNVEAKALDNISVNAPGFCKQFSFDYDYFGGDNTAIAALMWTTHTDGSDIQTDRSRLKLKGILEKSCDGTVATKPWLFDYYSNFLPRRLSFAQDHWGYYNGQDGNNALSTLIPTYTENTFTTVPGANRDPAWPAMANGTLTKITYPTGGSSTFEFEPNDVWVSYKANNRKLVANFAVGPGVGTHRPQTYTVNFSTNPYVFTIDYNVGSGSPLGTATLRGPSVNLYATANHLHDEVVLPAGSGSGQYTLELHDDNVNGSSVSAEVRIYELGEYVQKNALAGGLRLKTNTTQASAAAAPMVMTYTYRENGRSTGTLYSRPRYVSLIRNATIAQYGFSGGSSGPNLFTCGCVNPNTSPSFSYLKSPCGILPLTTTQGHHIGYDQVSVAQAGNGRTDYYYYGSSYWKSYDDVCYRNINTTVCDPTTPFLPAVPPPFDFSRGQLKQEMIFDERGQYVKNRQYTHQYDSSRLVTPAIANKYVAGACLYSYYERKAYWKKQTQVIENSFAAGGTYQTTKTYKYDSPYHRQLTQLLETTSSGDVLLTTYKYAFDFQVPAGGALNNGISKYTTACAACEAQRQYETSNCPSAGCFGGLLHYLVCRAEARKAYIAYRRATFTDQGSTFRTAHDAAKSGADARLKPLLQLQDDYNNQLVETSHWKNNQLLTASYTSFGPGLTQPTTMYPAKQFALPLLKPSATFTSASISGRTLSTDPRYCSQPETALTFDQGNLLEVVTRGSPITCYLWGYSNTLPIVKAIGVRYSTLNEAYRSAGNNITALRGKPSLAGALLTTYGYQPLVGMTAQTDPTGRLVTYEYDALGRLVRTRDEQGRILSQQQYHYAGQ